MNRTGAITPQQFVAKWQKTELSERAASQEHFLDLCRLLGQPTPAEHDPTGEEYTFEKSITPRSASPKPPAPSSSSAAPGSTRPP